MGNETSASIFICHPSIDSSSICTHAHISLRPAVAEDSVLCALKVAVVSGVYGRGAVGLEHVVLLEILPVHGGHGTLDALGAVAGAVDGCDGLAEAAAVGGACDVADEWGHIDLVGVTGEGLVIPEPLSGGVLVGASSLGGGSEGLPGA